MRIGSPGTQICSHSAMLMHKKRVEVICLTPVMQTEIQSLHPYQLKPHRGGRKSNGILSGEILKQENTKWTVFFHHQCFSFLFFSHFFNPSTSLPISVSVSPHTPVYIQIRCHCHFLLWRSPWCLRKIKAEKGWKKETSILH